MFKRSASALLISLVSIALHAQAIDSVHIFKTIPPLGYSTSLAETTGWKLLHTGAAYVSMDAQEMQGLNAAIEERRPAKHTHTVLAGLSHIGFIYLDRDAHVFCLAEEEGLIIDLTARREIRLQDWADRVRLRAALLALGL